MGGELDLPSRFGHVTGLCLDRFHGSYANGLFFSLVHNQEFYRQERDAVGSSASKQNRLSSQSRPLRCLDELLLRSFVDGTVLCTFWLPQRSVIISSARAPEKGHMNSRERTHSARRAQTRPGLALGLFVLFPLGGVMEWPKPSQIFVMKSDKMVWVPARLGASFFQRVRGRGGRG